MAENEQQSGNPPESSEWSLVVSTQGVEPMSGKGRGPKVNVTGLYRGKVVRTNTIISNEKQEKWIVFECVLTRTPKNGSQFLGVTQNVLLPGTPDMKNFDRKWKTAALNVAKDPANLEKPGAKVKLGPKNFIDKEVWIYVQAAPEGKLNKDGYPADPFANLCTPAEAAELAKEEETAGAASHAAAPAKAAAPAGTNGATAPAAAASTTPAAASEFADL